MTRPRRPLLLLSREGRELRAARTGLAREAARAGFAIEVIAREERLASARRAIRSSRADALAVCGAPWLQAGAAAVAAAMELPFGCIAAADGDLLARDLGAEREDPAAALEAFLAASDAAMDLAEVNGIAFVDYVAIGLHVAAAPGREAPQGAAGEADRARVSRAGRAWPWGPDGAATPALLVSNNRFALRGRGIGARAHLDAGVLGVATLAPEPREGGGGPLARWSRWRERSSTGLELTAGEPVRAEVDGIARMLRPPLRFRVLPGAVRVRAPLRLPEGGVAGA